jgi:hypothetical protein
MLGAKDVGQTIALTLRATDTTGTTTAYANVTGPVAARSSTLAATVPPVVTGNAMQGQVLTVSSGTWSTTPGSTTYAWQRCNPNGRVCAPIDGATSSTYTVTAADMGHALLAIIQATAGAATQAAWSTATTAVT